VAGHFERSRQNRPHTLAEGVRLLDDPPGGLAAARRMAALGLLDPVGATRTHQPTEPQTLTAWLHVNNQCNLDCPYCYIQKSKEQMAPATGRQAVEAVFRSALANGFGRVKLKYAGGEATLNFHTVLILHDHARQLAAMHGVAMEGVILSNGVAISDRLISELQARNIRLMISLDGIGEAHDAQRPLRSGRGSFAHVERSLAQLDGAFVVSNKGVFVSACRYIDVSSEGVDLPLGLGSRHMAAASITRETRAMAVVVSESSIVRVFDDGKIVSEVIPEVWLLRSYGLHLVNPAKRSPRNGENDDPVGVAEAAEEAQQGRATSPD
jgi:uncharacterized Fe-S cluster-containing radical SAM superfamily protein